VNPVNHRFYELFNSLLRPGQDPMVLALTFDEVEDPTDETVKHLMNMLMRRSVIAVFSSMNPTDAPNVPQERRNKAYNWALSLTRKIVPDPNTLIRLIQKTQTLLNETSHPERLHLHESLVQDLRTTTRGPGTLTCHLQISDELGGRRYNPGYLHVSVLVSVASTTPNAAQFVDPFLRQLPTVINGIDHFTCERSPRNPHTYSVSGTVQTTSTQDALRAALIPQLRRLANKLNLPITIEDS